MPSRPGRYGTLLMFASIRRGAGAASGAEMTDISVKYRSNEYRSEVHPDLFCYFRPVERVEVEARSACINQIGAQR